MRHTRYQGAIIQDDKMLLIRHTEHALGRSYWVIPGGGREAGETEVACVMREMLEETNNKATIYHCSKGAANSNGKNRDHRQ